MGIDYNAKLVFGIFLTVEQKTQISNKHGEDMWVGEDSSAYDDYPDLFFDSASPYFDAPECDRDYFISIIEPRKTSYTCEELTDFMSIWKNTTFAKCLLDFGIDFAEPKLYAVPHIW